MATGLSNGTSNSNSTRSVRYACKQCCKTAPPYPIPLDHPRPTHHLNSPYCGVFEIPQVPFEFESERPNYHSSDLDKVGQMAKWLHPLSICKIRGFQIFQHAKSRGIYYSLELCYGQNVLNICCRSRSNFFLQSAVCSTPIQIDLFGHNSHKIRFIYLLFTLTIALMKPNFNNNVTKLSINACDLQTAGKLRGVSRKVTWPSCDWPIWKQK